MLWVCFALAEHFEQVPATCFCEEIIKLLSFFGWKKKIIIIIKTNQSCFIWNCVLILHSRLFSGDNIPYLPLLLHFVLRFLAHLSSAQDELL